MSTDSAPAAVHPSTTDEPVLAGHSFTVRVDTGLVARQEYSADGESVTLTVLEPGNSGVPAGPCGTVDVFVRRLSHGTYQVGWVEPNGVVICNVQDLVAGTMSNFLSKPPLEGGERRGEMHTGRISRDS
ncbi:MoaF-related domain-containing protein [Streptomyces sp. NPDC001135]